MSLVFTSEPIGIENHKEKSRCLLDSPSSWTDRVPAGAGNAVDACFAFSNNGTAATTPFAEKEQKVKVKAPGVK